jgi:hypothetical protein
LTWEEYDRDLRELARKTLEASQAGDVELALFYVAAMIGHANKNYPLEPLRPQIERQTAILTACLIDFIGRKGPTLQ